MPSSRQLISSQVLGSTTATVTFSSIPGTYKDLILKISARTGRTDPDYILLTFNSDTTSSGTTYSDTYMLGSGSAATSGRDSSGATIYDVGIPGVNQTSNTFSSTEIYIPSYTASDNKPFSSFSVTENNATAADIWVGANLWKNTAAITQINMKAVSSFVAGSSFYLYGLAS